MYKGIIFSILCMPLISFGMDRDITDQGFNDFDMMLSVEQDLFALEQRTLPDTQGSNDPDLQAAVLSLFTDDDSLASSQSNAVNTQLYFPDLQSAESGVLYCDEILGDEADKEDTQLSASYDDFMLQHVQARYDAINTQGSNDPDLQAAMYSLFANDDSSVLSQSSTQGLHFPDLQPAQIDCDELFDQKEGQQMPQGQIAQRVQPAISYNASTLKEIQERYKRNKKQCPIEDCLKFLKRSRLAVDHVAGQHYICLCCEPPLSYKDRVGIEEHFIQSHPDKKFAYNVKRMASQEYNNKEVCKKCGKVIRSINLKSHIAKCNPKKGIKYTDAQLKLKKLKERYKTDKTLCPIEGCLQSSKSGSNTMCHVAVNHNICLFCEPPYCAANVEGIMQHFKEKHPAVAYAGGNTKIACGQCGKEILASSMARHLSKACKGTGSVAAATTSDKH